MEKKLTGIHYYSRVALTRNVATANKDFIKIFGHNEVRVTTTGLVKEVHGQNVTVDCNFSAFTLRLLVTKSDLRLVEDE